MNDASPRPWLLPLAIAGAAALAVSATGGFLTDVGPWFRALNKPTWQPPDWVFAPVWTTLYVLCAISAALAWRTAPDAASRRWTVILFVTNAVLNVGWSFFFFHLKRPDWAAIEIVPLWLSIAAIMLIVGRWSRTASLLLLPYLLWVAFASALTWTIVALN